MLEAASVPEMYQTTLSVWCRGMIALGDPVNSRPTASEHRRYVTDLTDLVHRADALLEHLKRNFEVLTPGEVVPDTE